VGRQAPHPTNQNGKKARQSPIQPKHLMNSTSLVAASSSEEFWRAITSAYSAKVLCTWGSLLIQTGSFVLCSLPSVIFALIPAMDKYRYQPQPSKKPSWDTYSKCLKLVGFSHFGMFYPLAFSLYFVFGLSTLPFSWETMPAWYITLAKLVAALYVEDTWHYFAHRALHIPRFYKAIHKLHHTFTSPFSFAAEYAHPIETIILGMGFFIPVVMFCDHLVFFWFWLALRTGQACDSHSGYNVWNPMWLLPFYGGSFYHDFHHSNFIGNYSSSFTHWDKIFGTDKDFKKHLAQKELKDSANEKFKEG
jgi:methylsterol monooxygenase